MSIPNVIANTKRFTISIGTLLAVIPLVTFGMDYLDERYVSKVENVLHIAEFKHHKYTQADIYRKMRIDVLEDKLFELEMIPEVKRTTFDKAKIIRYNSKLIQLIQDKL